MDGLKAPGLPPGAVRRLNTHLPQEAHNARLLGVSHDRAAGNGVHRPSGYAVRLPSRRCLVIETHHVCRLLNRQSANMMDLDVSRIQSKMAQPAGVKPASPG